MIPNEDIFKLALHLQCNFHKISRGTKRWTGIGLKWQNVINTSAKKIVIHLGKMKGIRYLKTLIGNINTITSGLEPDKNHKKERGRIRIKDKIRNHFQNELAGRNFHLMPIRFEQEFWFIYFEKLDIPKKLVRLWPPILKYFSKSLNEETMQGKKFGFQSARRWSRRSTILLVPKLRMLKCKSMFISDEDEIGKKT